MPITKKEEIEELIAVLNTNKYYERPNMQETKENWLNHLTTARDNYDNMPDGLDMKCKLIHSYHCLNMVNMESAKMYANTIKEMLTLTKTIIEKTMENKTEKKEVLDVDVNNNKIIE
jgi:hypothetical protein